MTRSRALFLVVACLFAVVPAFAEDKPAAKSTPWKMSGDLEEACSCDAACPCWFDSKPTKMNCSGGFVLFIDKGSYGNVKLDGLGAAFIGASKDGTTMMESIGDWNFMTMYVDEKANPEQRKALLAIMKETSPPAAPPERTYVRYVPITRTIQGKEHIVTMGIALLPAYWYFWRQPLSEEHAAIRKWLAVFLAISVWYAFLVGHVANDFRGVGS